MLLTDLRRNVDQAELGRYVGHLDVGWLNRKVTMATFRHMLIKRAYTLEETSRMTIEAGIVRAEGRDHTNWFRGVVTGELYIESKIAAKFFGITFSNGSGWHCP